MEKWKRFERLTAALSKAQDRGAAVKWHEDINDLQIDVTVRRQQGSATHLEIIECRDHKRRITQEQVLAFVMKIAETGADAGSIVTAQGFQKGARRLARKHGVRALKLEEVPAEWPDPVGTAEVPYVRWREPAVRFDAGWYFLSVRDVEDAKFTWLPTGVTVNFAQFIERPVMNAWDRLRADSLLRVTLPPGWTLQLPDRDGALRPLEVAIRAQIQYQQIQVTRRFPEEVRPSAYQLTDELNATAQTGAVGDLPLGFDSVLQKGGFYRDSTGREYFCEDASEDSARMVLLASKQFGVPLYANAVIDRKEYGDRYLRISDAATKERLEREYAFFREKVKNGETVPGSMLPVDLQRGAVIVPRGMIPKRWW